MRPYDEEDLAPYEYVAQNISLTEVFTDTLVPTQDLLRVDRLLHFYEGGSPEGSDPYPHIVVFQGKRYIHNGHHRWVVALFGGETFMWVRIVPTLAAVGLRAF